MIYLRLGRIELPVEIALLDEVLPRPADELRQFLVVTRRRVRVRRR